MWDNWTKTDKPLRKVAMANIVGCQNEHKIKKHDAASSQEAKVYGALKRLQQKADLLMVWHYATLV